MSINYLDNPGLFTKLLDEGKLVKPMGEHGLSQLVRPALPAVRVKTHREKKQRDFRAQDRI